MNKPTAADYEYEIIFAAKQNTGFLVSYHKTPLLQLCAPWSDRLENYILGCTIFTNNLHVFPVYFNVIILHSFTPEEKTWTTNLSLAILNILPHLFSLQPKNIDQLVAYSLLQHIAVHALRDSLFKLGRYNRVFLEICAQIPMWAPMLKRWAVGSFFSRKYSRRAHRDPQKFIFS